MASTKYYYVFEITSAKLFPAKYCLWLNTRDVCITILPRGWYSPEICGSSKLVLIVDDSRTPYRVISRAR